MEDLNTYISNMDGIRMHIVLDGVFLLGGKEKRILLTPIAVNAHRQKNSWTQKEVLDCNASGKKDLD